MDNYQDIRRGRHCVTALHVHLVFVTKYRRHVLDSAALLMLRDSMANVCCDFGAELAEMNGEDDHVHLLVTYPPTVALSRLVNSLKGVSSRMLRQARSDLEPRFWKGSLWSPSYFAVSCGGAPLHLIQQYIEAQKKPGR